jgi:hypothetical protein
MSAGGLVEIFAPTVGDQSAAGYDVSIVGQSTSPAVLYTDAHAGTPEQAPLQKIWPPDPIGPPGPITVAGNHVYNLLGEEGDTSTLLSARYVPEAGGGPIKTPWVAREQSIGPITDAIVDFGVLVAGGAAQGSRASRSVIVQANGPIEVVGEAGEFAIQVPTSAGPYEEIVLVLESSAGF